MNDAIAAAMAQPWAMERQHLEALQDVLSRLQSGAHPQAARKDDRKAAARQRTGTVAFIPLYGVMTQRADLLAELLGWTPTELVGQWVDQVAADPAYDAMVLDVDSPGGSVFGTAELAAKVAAAAKRKKVIAVANSMAASAAYYVASQASELVVTPSGMVGSVGVYLVHVDRSGEMEQLGRRVTFVAAGERKVAGNEYAPLDDLGRQEMTGIVQGYYDQFVQAVARGRKVSPATVRAGFGKGGMVLAREAVKEGMADRVATLDEVLAGLGVARGGGSSAAAGGWATAGATKGRDWDVEIRRRKLLLDADHQPAAPPAKPAGQKPVPTPAAPARPSPARPHWGGRYDRALAVHEAGHAVVAHALGGHVERVTIEPAAGADGHVLHAPGLSRFNRLAVLKAGAAAVRLLGHDSSGSPPNADGDERLARELSPDPQEHAAAEREATFLITHSAGRVVALADALQKHRTLTAADVKGIIGGR